MFYALGWGWGAFSYHPPQEALCTLTQGRRHGAAHWGTDRRPARPPVDHWKDAPMGLTNGHGTLAFPQK